MNAVRTRRLLLAVVAVGAVLGATACDFSRWNGPAGARDQLVSVLAAGPRAELQVMTSGVAFTYGCVPGSDRCRWGAYDAAGVAGRGVRTVWLGPPAFANRSRLYYTATHELAHHWFRTIADDGQRARALALGGDEEGFADCVALSLGANQSVYRSCDGAARQAVRALLVEPAAAVQARSLVRTGR